MRFEEIIQTTCTCVSAKVANQMYCMYVCMYDICSHIYHTYITHTAPSETQLLIYYYDATNANTAALFLKGDIHRM